MYVICDACGCYFYAGYNDTVCPECEPEHRCAACFAWLDRERCCNTRCEEYVREPCAQSRGETP